MPGLSSCDLSREEAGKQSFGCHCNILAYRFGLRVSDRGYHRIYSGPVRDRYAKVSQRTHLPELWLTVSICLTVDTRNIWLEHDTH